MTPSQATQPTPPAQPAPPWRVEPGQVASAGAGLVLLAAGALLGRADAALLGVPIVLGAAHALVRRPHDRVRVDVRPTGSPERPLAAELAVTAPVTADAVRLRADRPGHRPAEALVAVDGTRELRVTAASVRTGGQPLFLVEHQGVGSGAATVGLPGRCEPEQVLVLPAGRRLGALPLPGRLRGLTGQHESRRPGSGGGLRDVHPFAPGDAPRQVDWKVTARRSPALDQLYVRRTTALGEAVVTVVVDSRDDVGPDPLTWAGTPAVRADDATSLDLARQAAAALAEAYLGGGDRVGIEDLGVRRRAVRSGTGRRQLERVRQQLAWLRPEGDPPTRVRPPRIGAGALVYVLSTFLDPEAAAMAATWRRTGHLVVAVDVLPDLRLGDLDTRRRLALRLVLGERDDRLADVRAAGVDVVRWVDGTDAVTRLQAMARAAHRGRPGARSGAGAGAGARAGAGG